MTFFEFLVSVGLFLPLTCVCSFLVRCSRPRGIFAEFASTRGFPIIICGENAELYFSEEDREGIGMSFYDM